MERKICHNCYGCLYPLSHVPGYDGCSCGNRRHTKEMITLDDILTSSGKYKDRRDSPECTQEVKDNATKLINAVNALLIELKIAKVSVSSGFRTSVSNAATPSSAKKSNHMKGLAVDLVDVDGKLDELFEKNIPILEKHGLYLEDPHSTKSWSHLQIVKTHHNPFKP